MGFIKRTATTATSAADAIRRLRNIVFQRLLTEEQEDALLYRADPALMNALYWLAGTSNHNMGYLVGDEKGMSEEEWMDFDVNDVVVRVAALRRRLGLRAEPHL